MATRFDLRTTKKKGFATLYVRVRSSVLNLNHCLSTNLQVPVEKWNLSHDGAAFIAYTNTEEGGIVMKKLEKIRKRIDSLLDRNIAVTKEQVAQIVDEIVYEDERELERQKAEEEARRKAEENRVTLNKFIAMYIQQIENGARQTERGRNFAPSTVKSIKSALNQFKYFQDDKGKEIDFADVDMQFYYDYTAYLKGKNYSINSIGKCVKELKTILATAEGEGYNTNSKYKDKKFKGTRVEVDNIYLTKEDLKKMINADLSDFGIGHQQALDIFMVGVWTAQRVSDYNNISREYQDLCQRSH